MKFAMTVSKRKGTGIAMIDAELPARLGKGDEGIMNLIPRRHNARVYYGSITR
jgi:hypothetical protein